MTQVLPPLNAGKAELAIVVGVSLGTDDRNKVERSLDELEALLKTLGIDCAGRMIQRRQKLTPKSLVGWGKVDEIRELAERSGARHVVFDHPLSGPQVRNIEEATKCQVLDRQGVILDIFAKHARTNTAKTQVEIAQLEYMLPRLTGAWTHFQRQSGGHTGARGMGEKQIEIDRRRIKERIARLKSQLKQIAVEKATQRKSRRNELKVALVGYTNSGKSTLLNTLTKAQSHAKDELFATLDPNVKVIDPLTRPKILLSDTVGFIQNLPHGLVESFRSTLDEVLEADLLLHVVDLSHDQYREHMLTTEGVLQEIGAGDIPQILVFNKIDQVDDPLLPRVMKGTHPGSISVSALSQADAMKLREHIYEFFVKNFVRAQVKAPLQLQSLLSLIYKSCLILDVQYDEDGFATFDLRTNRPVLARLQSYLVIDGVSSDLELRNDDDEIV